MKTILTTALLALAISGGAAFAQESSSTDGVAPTNQTNTASEDDVLRPFYADEGKTQPLPMDQIMAAYDKMAPSQQDKVKDACSKELAKDLTDFCMSVHKM